MTTLAGHILVAAPDLLDPNFRQTLVLIVQHGGDGALGLVLNRPTDTPLRDAWAQVSSSDCQADGLLHVGGPCQGPLMVVHQHADAGEIEILPASTDMQLPQAQPGVHFSTESEKVQWIVEHNQREVKFFVGYAGWTAGQLETEMKTGSWLVLPASVPLIFKTAPTDWKKLIRRLQAPVNPRIVPPDPSWN
ncbi:MAG: YqgE/AlgH family protein [Phycisphaerales bacterium]|nr:YqgE/AlgH family protein [Phycisphaerales bacterium]